MTMRDLSCVVYARRRFVTSTVWKSIVKYTMERDLTFVMSVVKIFATRADCLHIIIFIVGFDYLRVIFARKNSAPKLF